MLKANLGCFVECKIPIIGSVAPRRPTVNLANQLELTVVGDRRGSRNRPTVIPRAASDRLRERYGSLGFGGRRPKDSWNSTALAQRVAVKAL